MFMGSRQEHKFSAVTIFTISSTFHLFPLGFFDCSINFLRSTSTPNSKNNNKRVGINGLQIKRRPATDAYRSLLVGRGSLERDQLRLELRKYDDNGNGNVKAAIDLMSKTTTLHVHHQFICLPCTTTT